MRSDVPPPTEPMLSNIVIVDRYLNNNRGEVIEVLNF